MAFYSSKPLLLVCAVALVIAAACGEPLRPRSVAGKTDSTSLRSPFERLRALLADQYCYPGAPGCTTTITWTPANYFCGEDCVNGPAQMNPITGTFSKPVYRLFLTLGGAMTCDGTYGTVTVYNVQGRQVEQRDLVVEDTTDCGFDRVTCCAWTGDTLQFPGAITSIAVTAPQPATYIVHGGDPDANHSYVHVSPTPFYFEKRPPTVDSCLTGDELLDQQAMRDLLRAAWDSSNSDAAQADRRETRGWLFEDSTGNLVYGVYPQRTPIPPDNLMDSPCNSIGIPPSPEPGIRLARGHTHPFTPNEDIFPPACGFTTTHYYDVETYGGPSKADILRVAQAGIPGYIVDKVNLIVIPVGTDTLNAKSKVKHYPRVDPVSSCRRV